MKPEDELELELGSTNSNKAVDIDGEILIKKEQVDNLNEKINDLSDDNDKLKKKKMEKNVSPKKYKILMGILSGVAVIGLAGAGVGTALLIKKDKTTDVEFITISFDTTDKGKVDEGVPLQFKVKKDTRWKDVAKPTPVGNIDKEKDIHYWFNKWLKSDGSEINDDEIVSTDSAFIADYTSTSTLKEHDHTIKYDGGEHGIVIGAKEVTFPVLGDETKVVTYKDVKEWFNIPQAEPKQDYKFVNWLDDNGNELTDNTIIPEGILNVTANYVYIEPTKQYTIKYEFDSEVEVEGKTELSVNEGTKFIDIYKPTARKEGWKIDGWKDKTKGIIDDNYELDGDLELEPIWIENANYGEIIFKKEKDDIISGSETTSFRIGDKWGNINKPTIWRNGCEFSHWEVEYEGRRIKLTDDISIPKGFTAIPTFTEGTTYCQIEYELENKEYGKISGQMTTYVQAGTKCKEISFPWVQANEGYEFDNWYIDGKDKVTDESTINGNCKIIAKFNFVPIILNNYVNIVAQEDSVLEVSLKTEADLNYSTDGIEWIKIKDKDILRVPKFNILYLKGNNPDGFSKSVAEYNRIELKGDIELHGTIMSLLNNGGETKIESVPDNCFCNLFWYSNGITKISNDFLPATSVGRNAYECMFEGCENLKNTPKLNATSIENSSYYSMFKGCKSLINCPEVLPAENAPQNCYSHMFYNCKSLKTIPKISASKIGDVSCNYMFAGCSSLNITKNWFKDNGFWDGKHEFEHNWCNSMFGSLYDEKTKTHYGPYKDTEPFVLPDSTFKITKGCFSGINANLKTLKSVPDDYLPWNDLAPYCYSSMFAGCENLTNIPNLPATNLKTCCYADMFYGCKLVVIDENWFYNQKFWDGNHTFGQNWALEMFGGTNNNLGLFKLPTEEEYPSLQPCCFSGLNAYNPNIIEVPDNYLPWKNIPNGAYDSLFRSCKNLKKPPQLPGNILGDLCYQIMFLDCTELKINLEGKGTKFFYFPSDQPESAGNCMFGQGGHLVSIKPGQTVYYE